MSNKIVFISIMVAIMFILLIILPLDVREISNAVVNSENGDIAICYDDTFHSLFVVVVDVFNEKGERLFKKTYYTWRYCDMVYVGDALCITFNEAGGKKIYCFDRDGKDISDEIKVGEIPDRMHFEDWKRSIGKATYVAGECEYRYESPNIFRRSARMYIKRGDNEILIYESME